MQEINVHEFSETLIETYRRYLFTTNLVADSEHEPETSLIGDQRPSA